MSKAPATPSNPEPESGLDLTRLEALTVEVMGRMRSLRELLNARAVALRDARDALEQYRDQLQQETDELSRREQELCESQEQRKRELERREQRCDELEVRLKE